MGADLTDILAIAIASAIVFIAYFKWVYSYWERRGLESLPVSTPFGNIKKSLFFELSINQQFEEIYKQFKSKGLKHGGIYMLWKPVYVPVDPEIIKHIMIKDFSTFMNRGTATDETIDPLGAHLVHLEDEKWRSLRTKLRPTFTSGKIKMMFQTIVDCTAGLREILNDAAKNHDDVEIKDVLARLTTDIIGSCAFGIECNSLRDPDAIFRVKGRKIFESNTTTALKELARVVLPKKVLTWVKFRSTEYDVEEFLRKVVKDAVDYREKNNVYRKDFMHLLIQLKNKGKTTDDGDLSKIEGAKDTFTMDELTAQAYVFFIAGFETSSTAMAFALYELALNQHVQEKARDEINKVLSKHKALTYEAVADMEYLDRIIHEVLRKYPIGPLTRVCKEDYTIPGTSVRIEKGTLVVIPNLALHYDPEYYPEPETFDPDRFTEENKQKRPACTWLGFGDGPRICIGLRFGMIQSKVGLAVVLQNYKISLSSKTSIPIEIDKKAKVIAPKGGVWLDVTKI